MLWAEDLSGWKRFGILLSASKLGQIPHDAPFSYVRPTLRQQSLSAPLYLLGPAYPPSRIELAILQHQRMLLRLKLAVRAILSYSFVNF